MRFLLTVYADGAPDAAEFLAAVRDSGELIDGHQLADPSTGVLVRAAGLVAEGSYLDSPVDLAAYYLLDCEDRDRAARLAALLPAAGCDAVEVRPVMAAAGLEM
ncbi:hypothetical protein D5S18_21550 [Nocardia panacis]|uniref:YCII-related domain-containing protein n=1 Tax=Nocardia panacis TaxID=2340916 RepID=A0A3A4K1V8_9NOCA|nr:YciI family protein [Nocardia panacis]RJO73750.1 hypothetical protein D5S18_21550 [Nocardia panacis]